MKQTILTILTDMGFSDLGCYGSEIATPYLDNNPFSPGLRTALLPLMRTNHEKQFPGNDPCLRAVRANSQAFCLDLTAQSPHFSTVAEKQIPVSYLNGRLIRRHMLRRTVINPVKMVVHMALVMAFYGVGGPNAHGRTSSLVSVGSDGKLQYGLYANEGQNNAVNRIPDFSRAGYQGGGVPIPFVPAVVTVSPGPGDDTALIQNAIDEASAKPMGSNGFRGAVLLKAGNYEVARTLTINTSGVVLRGEGSQATGGTRITLTATKQDNLIEVRDVVSTNEVAGTRRTIANSYVPVGATSFTVDSAAGYSVGDRIIVHRKTNDKWITDLGMDAYRWTAECYQLYYRRVVTAVVGNTISIDAPIVQVIEDQYGGGDIYKYTMSKRFENVGVEALLLESTYTSDGDQKHGMVAVQLGGVENAWVRQVTAKYFANTCVHISTACHQITVCDTPLGAMNWSVGFVGEHHEGHWAPGEPDGIWESHGIQVAPRSLYYAQLKERLGKQALLNVILPSQAKKRIWTDLSSWAGDGLFGDDVIVWEDDMVESPANTATLYGIVRNLQMLDKGVTYTWMKVSGPGEVSFAAASSPKTTVSFSMGGNYTLRLTASDGSANVRTDFNVITFRKQTKEK